MTTRTITRAHVRISSVLTLFGLVCSFLFGATPSAFAAPRAATSTGDNNCWTISSKLYPDKVLTLTTEAVGTKLVIKPKQTPPDKYQVWIACSDGALVNPETGWVVDVFGANPAPETPAIVWPDNRPATPNQRWIYYGLGMNVQIASQLHGQLLDVDARDKESVILYPANGGANQTWGFMAATGAMCTGSKIWDMKVITGSSSSITCPSGYVKDNQNLNEGTPRGDYIYVCLDRNNVSGNINPIRRLATGTDDTALDSARCDGGFTKINTDLNQGAWGAYIAFCYSRSAGDAAGDLVDVRFVSRDSAAKPTGVCAATYGAGYTDVLEYFWTNGGTAGYLVRDLNLGAGGKYIYTCQKRS